MPAPAQPAGTVIPPPAPTFQDQTLVQTMRLSSGGARLRVRFTNEYGRTPLVIGAARVALAAAGGVPAVERELTFSGRAGVSVPPGAPMLSDPVALPTRALSTLKIAIHLPETTPECSCHVVGGSDIAISPKGDYTRRPFQPARALYLGYRAFLSEVDVERPGPGRVVVAFGDSITDGYQSTTDTDRRYPDRLAERLSKRFPNGNVAVVNAGISGNRLLADGRFVSMGQSALARFDRDVLSVPGVTHVIVLEGVNDIGVGAAAPPAAADLIGAYRQLIARAHAHGVKVVGATLLPYEGAAYFRPEGETVRQAVNAWIRTGREFDRVADLDAVLRDPSRPSRMRADLQSGDWLHPNDAGYRAMGDAIDLKALD